MVVEERLPLLALAYQDLWDGAKSSLIGSNGGVFLAKLLVAG